MFQQWVVDNYVKIKKDRLQFCANNQAQLRSGTYQGLIDDLQNHASENDVHVGKMLLLPSTFIGSPRNMMQQYQDAMAMVGRHGKPDLFITMTCNRNWKEIQENLLPHQTAADRPDIVTGVFALKVKHLLNVIVEKSYFEKLSLTFMLLNFKKEDCHIFIY